MKLQWWHMSITEEKWLCKLKIKWPECVCEDYTFLVWASFEAKQSVFVSEAQLLKATTAGEETLHLTSSVRTPLQHILPFLSILFVNEKD